MRWIVLAGCALTWLPGAGAASETWTSVAEVGVVTVRVHWVSPGELTAAARAVRKRAENTAFGFSILRKNVSSGTYTCDVYLIDDLDRTWDRSTTSLGHEVAHCLGFSHQ